MSALAVRNFVRAPVISTWPCVALGAERKPMRAAAPTCRCAVPSAGTKLSEPLSGGVAVLGHGQLSVTSLRLRERGQVRVGGQEARAQRFAEAPSDDLVEDGLW